jgi:hypothetical protein
MRLSFRSVERKIENVFFSNQKIRFVFDFKMRRDCMQFEAAMTLAKAYDTEQIPYISAAHAEQLEFT